MIPEYGYFALLIALMFALGQTVLPILTVYQNSFLGRFTKPLVLGQFTFTFFASFCLMYAFVTNDFSVAYVAENSSTELPLFYKLAAFWGAHEGSLLLWVSILNIWTILVAFFSRQLPDDIYQLIIGILGFISCGFLLFLIFTSNPFLRLLPNVPIEGRDLNPLLQDPGMALHPPMLYMGYVGFAVAFAFALAALLRGQLNVAWAKWSRPWTLAAWVFLTLGITLGSGWAYRVLGWGGWWFWDPVENASFMPWLSGTALIHSLIVVEKRNAFKGWAALLAISTFSLSLLGTFLVRSGILTSVHSFASDPSRGVFMLGFLLVVIGGSLFLYAWRAPTLHAPGNFNLISRETFLLVNNVMLVAMMLTVLLGTLYPLILDALQWAKISVGAPYFNLVFIPLGMTLMFFMGIGPLCQWQTTNLVKLRQRLLLYGFTSVMISFGIIFWWSQTFRLTVMIATALAVWLSVSVIMDTWQKAQLRGGLFKLSFAHWGMFFAHIGIAVTVIGITFSSAYQVQRDIRIAVGEQIQVGGYDFYFAAAEPISGENYQGIRANFKVTRANHNVTELNAERREYPIAATVMTRAAIDAGVTRDLYVALSEPLSPGVWGVRIYYKPFVRWIWTGGILMMLGGLLALSDRRYRHSPYKAQRNTG